MSRGFTIVGTCRSCRRAMAGSPEGARALGVATHYTQGLCSHCHRHGLHPAGQRTFAAFERGDTDWMRYAACRQRGVDPNWFHPHDWDTATEELAKTVCARCPVQQPCLDDADDTRDAWAIRAGMTPDERRAHHQQQPEAVCP